MQTRESVHAEIRRRALWWTIRRIALIWLALALAITSGFLLWAWVTAP